MNEIGKARLLNVAKALRESKNPDQFTMQVYGHSCGTPACALGHYAARQDLQSTYTLREDGGLIAKDDSSRSWVPFTSIGVQEHFDITKDETYELFSDNEAFDDDETPTWGCGNAKTALEAAEYIEAFVARDGGGAK